MRLPNPWLRGCRAEVCARPIRRLVVSAADFAAGGGFGLTVLRGEELSCGGYAKSGRGFANSIRYPPKPG